MTETTTTETGMLIIRDSNFLNGYVVLEIFGDGIPAIHHGYFSSKKTATEYINSKEL